MTYFCYSLINHRAITQASMARKPCSRWLPPLLSGLIALTLSVSTYAEPMLKVQNLFADKSSSNKKAGEMLSCDHESSGQDAHKQHSQGNDSHKHHGSGHDSHQHKHLPGYSHKHDLSNLSAKNPLLSPEDAFKQLDTNNDGNLDRNEIKLAKPRLSQNLDRHFGDIDQDKNDQLTLLEITNWQEIKKAESFVYMITKHLDRDASGTISKQEISKLEKSNWSQYFSEADQNQDAQLTKEELITYFPKWQDHQKSLFLESWKKADTNSDGLLSKEEVSNSKMPHQWAHHFGQVDTNQDGNLSLDEAERARKLWMQSAQRHHRRSDGTH